MLLVLLVSTASVSSCCCAPPDLYCRIRHPILWGLRELRSGIHIDICCKMSCKVSANTTRLFLLRGLRRVVIAVSEMSPACCCCPDRGDQHARARTSQKTHYSVIVFPAYAKTGCHSLSHIKDAISGTKRAKLKKVKLSLYSPGQVHRGSEV